MKHVADTHAGALDGTDLVKVLAALSNPQRLRILAALTGGRRHVSQLARDVQLGRPLVHMHLQRLEAAGLVTGSLELSEDGKAMKFYDVVPFDISLTPALIAAVAPTLDQTTTKEST